MANYRSIAILLVIIVLSLIVLISSGGYPRASLLVSDPDPPRQDREGTETTASNRNSVHLQVVIFGSDEESDWITREARAYMDRHPHVRIELTTFPDTVDFQTVKHQIGYESRADVYLLDNLWVQRIAAKGLLAPVTASGMESLDSAVRQQLEWNGFVWAVPYYTEPYVIVWNRNEEGFADENGLVRFERLQQAVESWEAGPDQDSAEHAASDRAEPEPGEEGEAGDGDSAGSPPSARWSVYFDIYDPISAVYFLRGEDEFTRRMMAQAAAQMPFRIGGHSWTPPLEAWERMKKGQLAAMVVPVSLYAKQQDERLSAAPLLDDRDIGQGGQMWSRGKSFAIRSDSRQAEAAMHWISWIASNASSTSQPGLPPFLAEWAGSLWTVWLNSDLKTVREWVPSAKFLTGSPELPHLLEAYREAAMSYKYGTVEWKQLLNAVYQITNPASSSSF